MKRRKFLIFHTMKKPVISTNVGGIPEIIENGFSGLLIPPNDPKAIENAVLDLLFDKEKARDIGKNALEVSRKISVQDMASSAEYINE
ncbi:MAG: glycosyltransferase [Candidatus Saganbacteria bacterium]|nr:glycosyltransferase [Candidatus Saganbacteria bacterium]